jgi:LPS-assembly protein
LPQRPPLCRGNYVAPPTFPAPPTDLGLLEFLADQAELRREGATTVSGSVIIRQGTRTAAADRVTYFQESGLLEALDGIRVWDERIYVEARQALADTDTDRTWLEDAEFRLLDQQGRGEAEAAYVLGKDWMLVDSGSFTSCDPRSDDWWLRARTLTLDREADLGVGRHATIEFHGVPVFYTPYIDFSLSGARKSGLLPPTIGVSERTGFDLTLPYYWNIAPERDATLGVRQMTRRGTMFQAKYRYLMADGRGDLQAELLPDDREDGDSRGLARFRHEQEFSPRLRLDVDAASASDKRYFTDLGTNLAVASEQYLLRRATLTGGGSGWTALGRVQDYQTVDPFLPRLGWPYARLPQVQLKAGTREPYEGLDFSLVAEAVNFAHGEKVEGSRLDLLPSASFAVRTPGTFVVPGVSFRYTGYELRNAAPGTRTDRRPAGSSDTPQRALPIASLDSGAFLERGLELGGRSLLQTLEPRAFYLYVPHEDQDDLPDFDTAEYTLSFFQLFRQNRFSGADRQGDANQLTLALTSRLLDWGTGEELARVSVGQIQYFEDPRVGLARRPPDGGSASDVVAELAAALGPDWQVRTSLRWDTGEERTDQAAVYTRYQPVKGSLLNLGFRYEREELDPVKQTDVSFRWQLGPHWSVVGRWNHDIPEDRVLETFAGVEYESCCWGVRAVARRYLAQEDNVEADYTYGLFLQLELKGLGGFGGETVDFLEKKIAGYENYF